MENRPRHRRGILFVVSAPSGAGKSTLVRGASEDFDFSFIVSCTTREPRQGESEGVDYHFLDTMTFQQRIEEGAFLEYAKVHGGSYYGTPRQPVLERIQLGQDVLLDIDVEGAQQIRALDIPWVQESLVDIFIMPPEIEELEKRLRERGTESEEQIQTRLTTASRELPRWSEYQYTILSRSKEEDLLKFKSIIIAERMRASRYHAGPE
ncbi:MAG: guanylate kinase [Verrucomicrobiota bacterium]